MHKDRNLLSWELMVKGRRRRFGRDRRTATINVYNKTCLTYDMKCGCDAAARALAAAASQCAARGAGAAGRNTDEA